MVAAVSHSLFSIIEKFEPVSIPETRMFAFPTRMMDSWVPQIEIICLPQFSMESSPAVVEVADSSTLSFRELRTPHSTSAGIRRLIRNAALLIEKKRNAETRVDGLVYDARNMDNSNIAHLIQHHAASLLFTSQKLAHDNLGELQVSVILNSRVGQLAIRFFEALGYKVVLTDNRVAGRLIQIHTDSFYFLLPSLSSFNFFGYESRTPSRIFISRRGSRCLLNEVDVEAFLHARGFTKIFMEDYPLCIQWSYLRNATDIVAIHGAGLGALAFNNGSLLGRKPAFRLTELFGAGFLVDCFRRYTAILKGSWTACRGKITGEIVRDVDERGLNFVHAFDSFEIDLESLGKALERHEHASSD